MRKKISSGKPRSSAIVRNEDALLKNQQWLHLAKEVAELPVAQGGSPHPTVKVGAVLVDAKGKKIAVAANRFAKGVDRRRPERYGIGQKSLWINCAEQMAIAEAARKGVKLEGAKLYVTLEPCAVCAGLISEVGIKQVFVPVHSMRRYAKLKAKWKNSIETGIIKLMEAGVEIKSLDVDDPSDR